MLYCTSSWEWTIGCCTRYQHIYPAVCLTPACLFTASKCHSHCRLFVLQIMASVWFSLLLLFSRVLMLLDWSVWWQTSRWLSRAELIKKYLRVKDLPADGVGQSEEDATSFVTCQFVVLSLSLARNVHVLMSRLVLTRWSIFWPRLPLTTFTPHCGLRAWEKTRSVSCPDVRKRGLNQVVLSVGFLSVFCTVC